MTVSMPCRLQHLGYASLQEEQSQRKEDVVIFRVALTRVQVVLAAW